MSIRCVCGASGFDWDAYTKHVRIDHGMTVKEWWERRALNEAVPQHEAPSPPGKD